MGHYGGSIRVNAAQCTGDMACMRVCPTEAIRVRGGKALILESRCIDCGECFRVCQTHAISAVTNSFAELSRFDYTVALASPVLYGQFGQGVMPERVLAALEKAGFDCACDLTMTCEAVSAAIERFAPRYRGSRPLISCFCPTVLRLIQVRYPDLIEQVLPIESPKEILAREIRRTKARELRLADDRIGILYLTPCPAKMLDVIGHPGREKSDIDGAIAISDIYRTVLSLLPLSGKRESAGRTPMSGVGMNWAILGGQTAFLKPESRLAVAGMRSVVRILTDIEMGKLRDVEYVELHSCPDGCVSGSLLVENPYVARARILEILGPLGEQPRRSQRDLAEFLEKGEYLVDRKLSAQSQGPLDSDVGRAIAKIRRFEEIRQSLPNINCGACGAPSCSAFADDVVRDEARLSDCVLLALQQSRAEQTKVLDVPMVGTANTMGQRN
jgi:Fe-S-cluster-containing hydrogenase component 2